MGTVRPKQLQNDHLVNDSVGDVVGHDEVELVDLVVDLETDLIGDQIRNEVRRNLDLLAANLDDVRLELPVALVQDRAHLRLAARQHGVQILLNSVKQQTMIHRGGIARDSCGI